MRTQEEILNKIEEVKDIDFFNFMREDLISYLDYASVKQFLDDGVTEEKWIEFRNSVKPPREMMIEYMPFAWEKAKNCRGLSSLRSIQHYMAWLWLDGNDELSKSICEYEFYGKPQLIEVCKYLNIDYKLYDDGIRVNTEVKGE